MKEERLYKLAYEALLNQWAYENDLLKKHPENEIAQIREKRLNDELEELRLEMVSKNIIWLRRNKKWTKKFVELKLLYLILIQDT